MRTILLAEKFVVGSQVFKGKPDELSLPLSQSAVSVQLRLSRLIRNYAAEGEKSENCGNFDFANCFESFFICRCWLHLHWELRSSTTSPTTLVTHISPIDSLHREQLRISILSFRDVWSPQHLPDPPCLAFTTIPGSTLHRPFLGRSHPLRLREEPL